MGILSGSIFHHFESKEEILEAVMHEVSVRSAARMRQAVERTAEPLSRVRGLLRCELDSIHGETSEAMTLLGGEWRSLGAAAQARVLGAREHYEAIWLEALQAAKRELVAVDAFILRRLVQSMTAGTATWYRPKGPVSIEQLSDQILSLIVRGPADRGLAVRREPVREPKPSTRKSSTRKSRTRKPSTRKSSTRQPNITRGNGHV